LASDVSSRRRPAFFLAASIALPLVLTGCDESLPPRNQPVTIIAEHFSPPHDTVRWYRGIDYFAEGSLGVGVTNVHDEVLNGIASLRANVELYLKYSPQARRTFAFSQNDLVKKSMVNRGMLTIEPESVAVMMQRWDMKTDEGKYFWDYDTLYQIYTEKYGYLVSPPLVFVMRGTAQAFAEIPLRAVPSIEHTVLFWLMDSIRPTPPPRTGE
jgi:hypothetical protein